MSLHDVPWHCDTLLIDVYRMVRSLEACYTRYSTSKSPRENSARGNDSLINSSIFEQISYLFNCYVSVISTNINLGRNEHGARVEFPCAHEADVTGDSECVECTGNGWRRTTLVRGHVLAARNTRVFWKEGRERERSPWLASL